MKNSLSLYIYIYNIQISFVFRDYQYNETKVNPALLRVKHQRSLIFKSR